MNILITGGAGYIGTELIYSLEADDLVDRIVVYDSLFQSNFNLFLGRSKLKTNKVHFVQGDILDSRKLKKQVDNADVVYHLAAKVTTPFADHNPHEFDQINNWGTAELSYLVQKSKVKKNSSIPVAPLFMEHRKKRWMLHHRSIRKPSTAYRKCMVRNMSMVYVVRISKSMYCDWEMFLDIVKVCVSIRS